MSDDDLMTRKHLEAQGIDRCVGVSYDEVFEELYGSAVMSLPVADLVLNISRLSSDAQEVVDIIINIPGELLERIANKKGTWYGVLTVRDVQVFLKEEYGWASGRINGVFSEIKKMLEM